MGSVTEKIRNTNLYEDMKSGEFLHFLSNGEHPTMTWLIKFCEELFEAGLEMRCGSGDRETQKRRKKLERDLWRTCLSVWHQQQIENPQEIMENKDTQFLKLPQELVESWHCFWGVHY